MGSGHTFRFYFILQHPVDCRIKHRGRIGKSLKWKDMGLHKMERNAEKEEKDPGSNFQSSNGENLEFFYIPV